jgi:hypothetical protein
MAPVAMEHLKPAHFSSFQSALGRRSPVVTGLGAHCSLRKIIGGRQKRSKLETKTKTRAFHLHNYLHPRLYSTASTSTDRIGS